MIKSPGEITSNPHQTTLPEPTTTTGTGEIDRFALINFDELNREQSNIETKLIDKEKEVKRSLYELRKSIEQSTQRLFYSEFKKDIEELKKSTEQLKIDTSKSDKLVENFKLTIANIQTDFTQKIDESKVKTVETLAVFVALFTFVSVEFQMIAKVNDLNNLIAFSFILAGLLILFVCLTDAILTPTDHKRTFVSWNYKFISIFLLSISLLAIGVFQFSRNEYWKYEGKNNQQEENILDIDDAHQQERATRSGTITP